MRILLFTTYIFLIMLTAPVHSQPNYDNILAMEQRRSI